MPLYFWMYIIFSYLYMMKILDEEYVPWPLRIFIYVFSPIAMPIELSKKS